MSDSVGSVSVDVVPDARGWAEKLRAQIRDVTVEAHVKADTAEAEAEIDEVARDRRSTVRVDVDKSQIEKGASALDGFLGKLGLIPALALTAGSALIPLVGVAGALTAALAAPLAIAGGGAALFAVLGGFAAKDTTEKLKNIDKLREKLHGLTKGTAEYAATQKQLRDAEAALTPQQKEFAKAQDTLTGAFQKFLEGKAGSALLGVMTQGMTVLSHVLPVVAPLIVAVGGALSTLLTDVDHAVQGQAFARFIGQVSHLAGRDLVAGGHILGDLASGVGSLVVQLDKHLSGDVLRGLERLAGSFADWASSKDARHDVRGFIDYFHENGPQVAHTIGAVARGIGRIVEALAPLGPPVLRIVEGVANALAGIPVPVLTALAGATAGLVAVQKLGGLKLLGALAGGTASGGARGTVAGLLTGGVQKVFVVNFPPGLGVPGTTPGVPPIVPTTVGETAGKTGFFGRLKGLLPAALSAPALVTVGDIGNEAPEQTSLLSQLRGGPATTTHVGTAADFDAYLKSQGLPVVSGVSKSLTATSTAFDALRTHAQQASRQIDLIGPHADNAFGQAGRDVDTFRSKLAAIQDKRISIIVQDQAAINALERIQAMRIADKNFNIYAHYNAAERAVGPGGGMGQNPHGSAPAGGAGGGASRVPVNLHLDDDGRTTLSGYLQDQYDANRRFERQHG